MRRLQRIHSLANRTVLQQQRAAAPKATAVVLATAAVLVAAMAAAMAATPVWVHEKPGNGSWTSYHCSALHARHSLALSSSLGSSPHMMMAVLLR